MAIKKLTYTTNKYIPVATGCCEEIYVCLKDSCNDITLDGNGLVLATIQNSARRLGNTNATLWENPRCEDVYQYTIAYDDSQMALGPGDLPLPLTCDCISEINPYVCTTNKLLTGTIEYSQICLEALDEYPTEDIQAGCIISLVGHATDPDGLYYYTGSAWVQWGAY